MRFQDDFNEKVYYWRVCTYVCYGSNLSRNDDLMDLLYSSSLVSSNTAKFLRKFAEASESLLMQFAKCYRSFAPCDQDCYRIREMLLFDDFGFGSNFIKERLGDEYTKFISMRNSHSKLAESVKTRLIKKAVSGYWDRPIVYCTEVYDFIERELENLPKDSDKYKVYEMALFSYDKRCLSKMFVR